MKNQAQKAQELDKSDELADFRNQFHIPKRNDRDSIYLCGNSLGLQPKTTENVLLEELKNWKDHGVEGHFTGNKPWVDYHSNAKKALSEILGAKEHEVVAMNNLTSNLHLALTSFYRPEGKRTKILIEKGAFPSDFYATHSQIVVNGFDASENLVELETVDGSEYLSTKEITNKIDELGAELALVMFPGVQYYTGQYFDMKSIAAAAHAVGAHAGFDLAHAVGNIPMSLHDDGIDFAVWCSYKYLNSGPGGVGGLFIHEKHGKDQTIPRMSGWWGHDAEARFKMNNEINPIQSVDGWQLSNVNILSQAAHLASLEVFKKADIHKMRAKSVLLTGYMEELIHESSLLKQNIKIITPSNPEERGCQLSLFLKNHGKSVFDTIVSKGVIMDWREPNVIRVAPVPLYNSFQDVYDFIEILKEALESER
ncbi:MAG: kynureninase [Ekhidna sp.]